MAENVIAVALVLSRGNIRIDTGEGARCHLASMSNSILNSVIAEDSEAVRASEGGIVGDRFGVDLQPRDSDSIGRYTIVEHRSAVLRQDVHDPHGATANELVDAMCNTLDEVTQGSRKSGNREEPAIIPISRSNDPVCEWDQNGYLLAGAFPTLFMCGGKYLPPGTASKEFINHLMRYYDGRFEQNVMFVAVLFNQMQRHAAVRTAAKVGTAHAEALAKFGSVASKQKFRTALRFAMDNPDSKEAKLLNMRLLRLLSLIGGTVPFSGFERCQTQPKLAAMRCRYGPALHWMTMAPPEHDDLLLQRIAELRKQKSWNELDNVLTRRGCRWVDLPEDLQQSARCRLEVSNRFPALSARCFENRLLVMQRDVLRCLESSMTRISRNYLDREHGGYSRIAAFNAVIEPQQAGRLHVHAKAYGVSWTPELLTRVMVHPELRQRAAKWLDAVCCTNLRPETCDWYAGYRTRNERVFPRACQISLPDARQGIRAFEVEAQKAMMSTNMHEHSFTCRKGKRGRYMCRLSRPAGIHHGPTEPLFVTEAETSHLEKGCRGILTAAPLSSDVILHIDEGYDVDNGKLLRGQLDGCLLWEMHRSQSNQMFVETNMALAALTKSHTNSCVLSCEDAADIVEEYQNKYMTKETGGLKSTVGIMLAALNQMDKYGSRAQDRNTAQRRGMYLATRTVNAFGGADEWPLSLMVYALLGHRSFLSSEEFWYVFPWDFVSYVRRKTCAMQNTRRQNSAVARRTIISETLEQPDGSDSEGNVEDELDQCIALMHNDERDGGCRSGSGGAKIFHCGNKIVFVTQSESYANRGPHFADYSPLEFECIVDIKPYSESASTRASNSPGRKRRTGFELGRDHPLYPEYRGYIRAKFRTAMLGGATPPTYRAALKSEAKMKELATYLLSTFVAWDCQTNLPPFSLDEHGLTTLFKAWDCSNASIVQKQRYRSIHNLLAKGYGSLENERINLDWRNRNADFWKDTNQANAKSNVAERSTTEIAAVDDDHGNDDSDNRLVLNSEQLLTLVQNAAKSQAESSITCTALRDTFWKSIGDVGLEDLDDEIREHIDSNEYIYTHEKLLRWASTGVDVCDGTDGLFSSVARTFQTLPRRVDKIVESIGNTESWSNCQCCQIVGDSTVVPRISPTLVTQEQYEVLHHIVGSLDKYGRKYQTLTMMHGGGGTGKSYGLKRIEAELNFRSLAVINLCPTGVGASQLANGLTFHSAFRVRGKGSHHLSPQALASMREIFHESVGLIVCDEVSMLGSELVVLMDRRLRAIYDPDRLFGGISILFVGDFLQLPVVQGTPICKAMYADQDSNSDEIVKARALFRLFKVFSLRQQLRAPDCKLHQANLASCRTLPKQYPRGSRWPNKETKQYQPLSDGVIDCLLHPISESDLKNDREWFDDMRILVTSNIDKAILTQCVATLIADRKGVTAIRWRKPIREEISPAVEYLLYEESTHPNLFSYFVPGAAAQILENTSGNLGWGVGNGTNCKLHSLGWDDPTKANQAFKMIEQFRHTRGSILEIPFPPDYINVVLLDSSQNEVSADGWPPNVNLETEWIGNDNPTIQMKKSVILPIGLIKTNKSKYNIRLDGVGRLTTLHYEQHAVEMATVMTVWKAQGLTLKRVLLLLEGTPKAPSWKFEHLYVALSRVRAAEHLRCFPLSAFYRHESLKKLKPAIYTVTG